MNERLDRFTKLLKEIFELDKSDLDFGIYRVMNLRKAQIEQFLTERLPQMVQETLAPIAQGSKEEIRAKMKQIEDSVSEMGMTVDALPDTAQKKQQYLQLQKQLAEGADLAALETDVYSALYSFFNRYYEDGDFISKRRYKEGVYAIPYEGEEVKLYWANQDQYYIKTSENFKDYTFVFDGITVHFRLVDATTEQNNNKESKDSKRTFMLFTEDEENYPGIKRFEYDPETAEIVIRFVYDIPEDKKKKYAEENYAAITAWLLSQHRAELNPLIAPIPTGKGRETTTLLEKHLKGYVAKNTFDYFIHKDLHGFLTRELDFFIKSEVMHLEDLDTGSEARVETYLAKVKAIKRVGKIIIDFLAQIEDFQKKLWLKKKFVVETNWCITLDKIDESFWPEIIGNKAQIDEWIAMYAIDEAEGWTNPPSIDFLRLNQNLIIDTKHFSNTFKFKLLESIPDLDEQTIGLLINGDNYHAIRLLQKVYGSSIRCTYIDPPYNSPSSEVLYKNSYKHSAWLKYLPKQIRIEYTLQLGSRKPRADIVIFDKDCGEQTQENIKIIIECKKEAVEARNAKDGVEQLKSYMSACPNCEWGMWTNGRQKEVYHKYVNDKGQIDFMDYNDIPSADGNLDDINRPKRTTLKNAYDDNLLFTFKTCHNHIYVNDGLQKQPAFFELLKVIFCKIEDERNITKPLEFYATSEERSNPDGQLTVKKRISKIFEQVKNKKKYRLIFDANDEIKLSPRSLAYIVSELQKYSLLNTNIDIKGKAYLKSKVGNRILLTNSYTMNLINAEDADGSAYRENIAKLHGSLLNAAITTQEYIGVRQSVSFAEVAVKNANTLKRKDYYQHHYECSRAHGKTKTAITVKTTGVSVFCFEQDGYDIDVLRQQSGFIGLTQRQKEQCEECYRELTPYRITSVLESGQATKQIGAYNFVNDAEKISEAIVIILYMLRCCLAHGDISPDESANEVYKYAYEVLCAPLRKLK